MSDQLERQQFLDRFFGPGNDFGRDSFTKPQRAWLQPWLDDVLDADLQATILPRWWDGQMVLYGLAPTREALDQLQEDAAAFLHPTYAQVHPSRPTEPADPIEQAIAEYFAERTFTITLWPQPSVNDLKSAFALLRQVRADRPPRRTASQRPPGLVLRDFEFALQQADEPAAQRYLQELEHLGVLSRDNHRFLWVRLMARFDHWRTLVDDERFAALQHVPRPAAVTDAMMEALFRVELAGFDLTAQAQQAVEHVREHLLPFHGTLASTAQAASSPGACKLALLFTIASQHADSELLPLLRTRPGLSPADHRDLDAIAALARLPAVPPTTDPLAEAQRAFQDDRFDQAFTLALQAEPGIQRTVLLVRCAFELSAVEPAQRAWTALEQLTSAELDALPTTRSFESATNWLLDFLGQTPPSVPPSPIELPLPTSWATWLARVDVDPEWDEALAVAERGALQWAIDDLAEDPKELDTLVSGLLEQRQGRAADIVHEALPYLRAFLQRLPADDHRLRPVHEALRILLVSEPQHSPTDLELIADLTCGLLTTSPDPSDYRQQVDDMLVVWERIASYRYLWWALDLLDRLTVMPASDPDARLRFLLAVLSQANLSAHRLDHVTRTLLRHLVAECGHPEVADSREFADLLATPPPPAPENPWVTTYQGKRIGIYTLDPPAAIRARQIMTEIAPDIDVILNHDHTATSALRQFARSADYLVIVDRSAKHAATDCIKTHHGPETIIYHAKGKGTSSILNELRPKSQR